MKRLETYYLLGLSYLKTYIHLAEAHGKKIMYIHTCILAFSKTVFFVLFCFSHCSLMLYLSSESLHILHLPNYPIIFTWDTVISKIFFH